jgi:hypothetical protein
MWPTNEGESKKDNLLKEISSILSSQSSIVVAQHRGGGDKHTTPTSRGGDRQVEQLKGITPSLLRPARPTCTSCEPTMCPSDGKVIDIDLEKKALDQLERSVQKEEMEAQISRERMSSIRDQVQVAMLSPRKSVVSLEVATSELSSNAWRGVVNERRQQWLSNHTLWDAPPTRRENPDIQLVARKPVIHENAKPLTERQLLSSSSRGTPFNEILQVNVFGVRYPLDLSSLNSCPNIVSFHCIKCPGTALTGLRGNSKLKEIVAQSNGHEVVDMSGLPNLAFLDISQNRLAGITGLDCCSSLVELNLNDNRITRITGLKGCRRLHHISVEGNLLISSLGLQELSHARTISLSENHLPKVEGLENCVLLQRLCLQQNNLQEAPRMWNHVLLREIDLSENSLDSIHSISSAWLPLLQNLKLSCNCITSLDPLVCLLMLEELDISNNAITDFHLLLQSLKGCYQLKSLSIHGNPVTTSKNFKSLLLKTLPSLVTLDEVAVGRGRASGGVPGHPIVEMCRRQIKEQDEMDSRHKASLESAQDGGMPVDEIIRLKLFHCKRMESLLVHHLREQEYFGTERAHVLTKESRRREESSAALVLQRVWRGRQVRRRIREMTPQWRSAVVLQRTWRGYCVRNHLWSQLPWLHRRVEKCKVQEKAAISIQAHFKGFILRKRLQQALEAVQSELCEEDKFEEIRLQEYPTSLDDIKPLDTPPDDTPLSITTQYHPSANPPPHPPKPSPQLPGPSPQSLSSSPQPPSPSPQPPSPSPQPMVLLYSLPGCVDVEVEYSKWREPSVGHSPAKVTVETATHHQESLSVHPYGEWLRSAEEEETSVITLEEHPLSSREGSGLKDKCSPSTDEGCAEPPPPPPSEPRNSWGLTSAATVELMKKRAQRQKNQERKAANRAKMTDPDTRLAAFRKQNKQVPSRQVVRRTVEKRASVPSGWESTKSTPTPDPEELASKQDYVQQWVDRQRSARANQVDRMWNSRTAGRILPKMEPHVLAGHKPRVVTATIQNDLVEKGTAVRRSQIFKPTQHTKPISEQVPLSIPNDRSTSSHAGLSTQRTVSAKSYSKSTPTFLQ